MKRGKPYKLYLYEKQLKEIQKLQAEKERYLSVPKYSLLDRCLAASKNLINNQNVTN